MNPQLQCVHGSSLATVFLRNASSLLELAGDHGETVLHSRLVYFDVVEEPGKHFLDLHAKYKFGFESWNLPSFFEAENPEFLIHRLDEGIGNTKDLIEGDIEGTFDWWDVTEKHGSASEVGLPAEAYDKLAHEIGWLHAGAIEESCALGFGVPFDISPGVRALYEEHVRFFGSNDNSEG